VVGVEHRATEIVQSIIARLSESFRRRGPSRGVAVTMSMPGDEHRLACGMVADFLRAGGYEVHHLGNQVTIDDLRLFLDVVPADVVAVSITTDEFDPMVLSELVKAVHDERPQAIVVVGGRGARHEVVESAGAMHVEQLAELTAALEAAAS
jgi:MerR family transcriptional regulator, light-induced transcriptional regulator